MTGNTPVTIHGKTYYLKIGDIHVDPDQVAAFVDAKMHELSRVKTAHSTTDLAVLTALNIAGELMELQGKYQAETEALNKKVENLVKMFVSELENID